MREKIANFKEIIESYYKKTNNNDVVFDFMHIVVHYTYIHLDKPIIMLNKDGGFKIENRDEREYTTDTIFIPFITNPKYYEENFSDDLYQQKRTLYIHDTIDVGISCNFNYDGLIKKIYEVMPKECEIISENKLEEIASENGYDRFEWKIYDKSVGLPGVAYGGPMWVYEIYGVKIKDYELNEDSKRFR